MRLLAGFLAFALCQTRFLAGAQIASSSSTSTQTQRSTQAAHARRALPSFSGTWMLDVTRSQFDGDRPEGSSVTIIDYDGKTWSCIQKHLNRRGQAEATSRTKLIVGSPLLHVERHVPFTFRSRIFRQGDAMVLLEHLRTDRGESVTNTTRYTLEDAGNTLIEEEKSAGFLGTQETRWVLGRHDTPENPTHPVDPDK